MSESLYRRNPENAKQVEGILRQRSTLVRQSNQTVSGRSASVRNPAYIKITGYSKSCRNPGGSMELPNSSSDISVTYNYNGGNIKPGPDLESVTIEYGGTWGLARKISAKIRCYTINDFVNVQDYFLLPGNIIDVTFGYGSSWSIEQSKKLTGFIVAVFSFNTTQDGHWICEFTAVSAAQAIGNLDIQTVVCNGCSGNNGQSGNNGPIKFLTGENSEKNAVKGIAQLIAADAQGNGTTSIDKIQDGHVVTGGQFLWSTPTVSKVASIAIFSGDHIRETGGKFWDWLPFKNKTESEVDTTNNQVYISLGYVVNRIINDQLLSALACSIPHERDKFAELQVVFDPEYSKCKVANGITSGDPLSILMIGNADYQNNSSEGKNFDKDCKNVNAVICNQSGNIKIENILIHRDVIVKSFAEATKERNANADQTDVKDTGEEVVNINDFFEKISDQISAAVGGAISLRLVEHPDNNKHLVVVDQNYGVTERLKCFVFDPIDGDGSTRTCTIQSNVGSQEYRAAMFVGASKKGDPISALRGCSDKLKDVRSNEFTKAQNDKFVLIKAPGNLGKNQFNGQDIISLKSAMGRMHKNNPDTVTNETVHYPGLSINIELDGVWGLTPGNAISSTQVPEAWRGSNSYFMVTKVTHTFQQSDWSTQIDGILAYYNNMEYIKL